MLDAFERIQIYPPAIEDQHIITARRSMNLILIDYGNRGVSLLGGRPDHDAAAGGHSDLRLAGEHRKRPR
jgi:hypothetical protein